MTKSSKPPWTLLTNHGARLLILASRSNVTVNENPEELRMTERSTTRILSDLRRAGYVSVRREGRRNRYSVDLYAPLRHPVGMGYLVRDLIGVIAANLDVSVDSNADVGSDFFFADA